MSASREIWSRAYSRLRSVQFDQADEELARMLGSGNEDPVIGVALEQLRATPAYEDFDVDSWLGDRASTSSLGTGRTNLGLSLVERDMVAQCLKICEWCAQHFDQRTYGLVSIGRTIYVGKRGRYDDHARSTIASVVKPVYEWVRHTFGRLAGSATPDVTMHEIASLVDRVVPARYPKTDAIFKVAQNQIQSLLAGEGGTWSDLGYSCRDTLKEFASEVYDPTYLPASEPSVKSGDAKAALKWTVRWFLRKGRSGGRYREGVEKVVTANWTYVNAVGHRRKSATEEDARLALMYTYLTIWLVDRFRSTSHQSDSNRKNR